MVAHIQSTSYMDNLRTSAMLTCIQATKYKGENKKDFSIVKYFPVHSNAHNDMESAGEVITEGMKITYFMNRLMDTSTTVTTVGTKSEPGVVATFQQEFYNSFSTKFTSHITLTKATSSNERNINAMYGDNEGVRGGRGQGRGRGG